MRPLSKKSLLRATGSTSTKEQGPVNETYANRLKVAPPNPDLAVSFDVSYFRQVLGAPELFPVDDADDSNPFNFPEGHWGDVERLLARGTLSDAEPVIDQWQAQVEDEGNDDALIQIRAIRIRALLMEGKYEEAEAFLGEHQGHPQMLLAEAGLALSRGDIADAREHLTKAQDTFGASLPLEHLNGLLAVSDGRIDVAMDCLTRVAKYAPEHAVARHQLGQLVLANGDVARAGTLFEQAMEISPTFPPPALALAEMLMDRRQLGEAMSVLHVLTESRPELLAGRLMQMRILLELGEAETALSLAELLKSQMPDQPEVCLQWAEAKARTGAIEETRIYLEKLITSLDGELEARCLRLLSQIALGSEPPRIEEAISLMTKAADLSESADDMLLDLAQLQLDVSDYPAAQATYEKLSREARDVGTMISGAIAAHNRGLGQVALTLAEAAFERVEGTPAEPQIAGFLEQLKSLAG